MVDISFSSRFQSIVEITNALIAQGLDPALARDKAKGIEKDAYEGSATSVEYQQRCSEFMARPIPKLGEDEVTDDEHGLVDEFFNADGPDMGHGYSHATFHQEGQMSTVYKAKAEQGTEKTVALKVMRVGQLQPPHNAIREVRILRAAEHDHVVPLLDTFQQPGDHLVLVFPFLRQDLENLLRSGTLTPGQSRTVCTGLFKALTYLHSINMIHRDVKPSNIMLRTMSGPAYLIDFGIAWSADDPDSEAATSKITDVGTTHYRPPEVLFGNRAYDSSLDLWAAGCVVAELIRDDHHPLFDAGPIGSELSLIKSIFSTLGTPDEKTWPSASECPDWGKVQFKSFASQSWDEILPGASSPAVDLVKRTVCFEPGQRLTASEALGHAYVLGT